MGVGFGILKTSGSGGGGGGTTITTVANYSALPLATAVSGKFYWCEASQGTKWLPFSVGGTYYPLGMYYSNGVTWEYSETPYQATLSEVNTGTNTDKFVSPYTFTNADKWSNYTLKTTTISTTSPLQGGGDLSANRTFSIAQANTTTDGYLSSADWNTFSGKQNTITLTTTGSSGASTFISNTLNVPTYTLSGLGGVPTTRQLTINGTAFDLSADRSWTVGTVTSVGLTMPTAFTVTNSPITGSGAIAVTGAGTSAQYIRGDGTLANFPNSTGGGSSVNYYLNGSVSQGTFGGDTYYQMSKTPILGAGTNFIRTNGAGNGYIASFITDAGDPSFLNIPGGNWNLEFYFQSSASGGSPQFYGEIYKVSVTNVFTLVASGVSNPEGITNGTTVDQYFTSIPMPQTSLLITDRLAIRIYVITGGRTITLHTENGNLCEVLTTFTTGLTALNGLTSQVQYFATGTSGTDFNISSVTDTHTFNLPNASATNRGALISSDWSTFNGKQDTISLTTGGTSGASTFISNTLNVPEYTLSGLGGVPTTRQLTINGTAFDLSADRSWTVGTVTSVSALTLGTTGTDLSSTVASGTTTPVITLNVPTASATNRGALSSTDWSTFNGKANLASPTFTGIPLVPIPALYDNSNQIINTNWINVKGYSRFLAFYDASTNTFYGVDGAIVVLPTLRYGDYFMVSVAGVGNIAYGGTYYDRGDSWSYRYDGSSDVFVLISSIQTSTIGDYSSTTGTITTTDTIVSAISKLNGNIAAVSGDFISKLSALETYRGININNNTTTVVTEGGVTMSSSASTTAQSVASTNFATKQIRLRYSATVVSGGRYTGTRGSALLWFIHGGFRYICDFNISDTSYSAGCQQFYGLAGQTTDLAYGTASNILVSTLINIIGIGSENGDANLQVFHNDATGTATKIDLGVGFPSNRTVGAISTTVYSIQLYNEPMSTNVKYEVVNNETGAVANGTISTNLPLTSQGLNFFASRCMSVTSVTSTGQFDLSKLGVYSQL